MAKKPTVSPETMKVLKRLKFFELQRKHGNAKQRRKGVVFVSPADTDRRETAPTSNKIGLGIKRDPDAHKWQKDKQEKKETIKEIERKRKSTSIQYNKGGYSYITPGSDPKDFGRK